MHIKQLVKSYEVNRCCGSGAAAVRERDSDLYTGFSATQTEWDWSMKNWMYIRLGFSAKEFFYTNFIVINILFYLKYSYIFGKNFRVYATKKNSII